MRASRLRRPVETSGAELASTRMAALADMDVLNASDAANAGRPAACWLAKIAAQRDFSALRPFLTFLSSSLSSSSSSAASGSSSSSSSARLAVLPSFLSSSFPSSSSSEASGSSSSLRSSSSALRAFLDFCLLSSSSSAADGARPNRCAKLNILFSSLF
ncbi:hypothetical protein FCN80_23545 [Martelella alba]|uniref:Uncharacterized protein n=1 Tax=Martelella alba TaxID=2590451 RepID=A0ABY2SG06_9HYPH|nr:hypothetical protein FCN80_23545 [Martelella alba]